MRYITIIGVASAAVSINLKAAEPTPNMRTVEKNVLAECVASKPTIDCRQLAQQLIAEHPKRTGIRFDILPLLNDDSRPFLRELVESSTNSEFHFSAATYLAYMGDVEIVPHLRDRQKQYTIDGNRRMVETIGFYLWQIKVQQSPQRLLAYIASKPKAGRDSRLWAIQRAHDRAIPKSEIREAILDHADKIKVNEHGFRPGLTSIKRIGIKLDILTEADLPDVKYHRDLSEIVSE